MAPPVDPDDLTPLPQELPTKPRGTQGDLDRISVQRLGTRLEQLEQRVDAMEVRLLDRQQRLDNKFEKVMKVAEAAQRIAEKAWREWRRIAAAFGASEPAATLDTAHPVAGTTLDGRRG